MVLHRTRSRPWTAGLLSGSILLSGCINIFWKTDPTPVARPTESAPVIVESPVKAHLADGSTVIFRKGAAVATTSVSGMGQVYPLAPPIVGQVAARNVVIPLDSVVGLETFQSHVEAGKSIGVSLAATAAAVPLVAGLMVALFGSCPTVYIDTPAGPQLEAEGFSYAIAPLLEQRDLDALRARPDADGVIRLDLRNEALETHYINNIELVEADHPAGSLAVPDQQGRIAIVDGVRPLARARDRGGRDVRPALAASDGNLFASDPGTVRRAQEGDLDDWIDLEARDLPPGDSVAVVLRLRNSLLNTVLLYDGMMGGRDALNVIDDGLRNISSAVDMSKWYRRTLGMRVSVDGGPIQSRDEPWTARLGDVGPIAFRDVAVVLPRPTHGATSVRVRLRFVADNWRIDRAVVAGSVARPAVRTIALAHVLVDHPDSAHILDDTAAVTMLREPDGTYLETRPGQRMTLEFNTARQSGGAAPQTTTYLLAWQGWYREWVRGVWLAAPRRTDTWRPGDAAMLTALRSWNGRRQEMEHEFYSSRIPVR